jgi:hypothetical protein
MSATRYWMPFTGTTNNELVNARLKYLAKPDCYVLDGLTANLLEFMDSAETLIINGHGSSGSLTLSETSDGGGTSVSVQVLASWLRYAGLPANHVRIRILGCETIDFARFLAIELSRDHPSIVVGGYRHKIFIVAGRRAHMAVGFPPVENTTGSGNVIWYNARGQQVQKPQQKLAEKPYDPRMPLIV